MTAAASKSGWILFRSVWPTSVLLSILLLGGYRIFDRRGFLVLLGVVGLGHLLICMRFAPRPTAPLLLSQSLIAITAVTAVVRYVVHVVGQPPSGLWQMVGSFASAELNEPSTYLYFGIYLLVFTVVVAGLLISARLLRLRSDITPTLMLSTAYAASAVNIAFDFSLSRPLHQVSGEPGADAFFFAAGLFGMEFSLTLHFVLLLVCCGFLLLPIPTPTAPKLEQR